MNKDSKQPATVDTPAFREALRKYRRDELYEGDSLFSLVAHIDAHAAAVSAKAKQEGWDSCALANQELIRQLRDQIAAPQQHAQAALSDQWIDSYADDYLSDGHHKDQVRSMVRALVKVSQQPVAAPSADAAPAVQVLDERAAFEIAFLAEGYPQKELRKGVAGAYAEAIAQIGWRFWQARAALMKGQK